MKLRKKSDAEVIEFEKCHEGIGTVFCENMLKPEDSKYGYQWFHYDRIPSGTTIGEHLHEGSEEIYYLLEGRGTLLFNGEKLDMAAGDISVVGDGETHGFINDSGADVIMIVVEIRPSN
jgi:mannose-6-phosphate isomerase-like protein (cupin superfamily)